MPSARPAGDPFRAIADPTRRLFLDALRARERRVTDLAAPLDISLPAVSRRGAASPGGRAADVDRREALALSSL